MNPLFIFCIYIFNLYKTFVNVRKRYHKTGMYFKMADFEALMNS